MNEELQTETVEPKKEPVVVLDTLDRTLRQPVKTPPVLEAWVNLFGQS